MATTREMTIWCDGPDECHRWIQGAACRVRDEAKQAGWKRRRVITDGKPAMVDLCPGCARNLAAAYHPHRSDAP